MVLSVFIQYPFGRGKTVHMNSHTCFLKQIRTMSLSNLPLIRTVSFFPRRFGKSDPPFPIFKLFEKVRLPTLFASLLFQRRTRERLVNVLTTCGHTVGLKQSPSVVFSSSSDLAVEKQGVNQQPSSEEASLTEGLTNETSKDELETQQVSGECCLLISVMCCLLVWNYPQCFASCKVIRNGLGFWIPRFFRGTSFRFPCQ